MFTISCRYIPVCVRRETTERGRHACRGAVSWVVLRVCADGVQVGMEDGDMIDANLQQVRETVLVVRCLRTVFPARRRWAVYVDMCSVRGDSLNENYVGAGLNTDNVETARMAQLRVCEVSLFFLSLRAPPTPSIARSL